MDNVLAQSYISHSCTYEITTMHAYKAATHQHTIMVNIMAQRCNQQDKLVHPVEALGDLAAHDHHVAGVQHIHHMAEVVVGVAVVVAAHSSNEGHDLALLNLEELQHAAVLEDVVHHLDLQSGICG